MSRSFRSSFLQEAYERGFVYQCTDIDGLDDLLSKEKVAFYIGCDATADCFHVGHLVQILIMRLLQKHGHRPILLIGGATTKIGDPSGRDTARPILTDQEIAYNADGLQKCLEPYLKFSESTGDVFVDQNKLVAARRAKQLGADTLIFDDSLQSTCIKAHVNLPLYPRLIINGQQPIDSMIL